MNETSSYADWLGRTTQIDDVLSAAPGCSPEQIAALRGAKAI
jgi:hypothetical protein